MRYRTFPPYVRERTDPGRAGRYLAGESRHTPARYPKERIVSLGMILLIVVILMLVGVLPTWPHARNWGYGPSGAVGLVVVVVLILFVMGRI